MRLLDIINFSFLGILAAALLFMVICLVTRRRGQTRRARRFGITALIFFLAALSLVFLGLYVDKRDCYEYALKKVGDNNIYEAQRFFEEAGDYEDARDAAKILKGIIEPTNDFPALLHQVRAYSNTSETLSQDALALFLLQKIGRQGTPVDALALLSAWPMELATANKLLENQQRIERGQERLDWTDHLPLRVEDPNGEWLRSVADPTSEKVVIYYIRELRDKRAVYFGFMDQLPARYLPEPNDRVGRVILLTEDNSKTATYPGGPRGGARDIEVTVCSLPDMRVLKDIGKAHGAMPQFTKGVRGAAESVWYGPLPDLKDIRALVAKAVEELPELR